MRLRFAFIAISLLALVVNVPASADGRVVIGALYNLTGGQQDLDLPSSRGARLAVDQANAGKGVLGRQVDLILADGKTSPQTIVTKARRMLGDNPAMAGLIGFSDTDMVLAAAPVAAEHGRVFITSGATSPLLPRQVPGFLYLACFGDNVQAAAGAEWAYHSLKARTAAVLYKSSSSYTRLLHGYFETRFEELGGEVRAVEPYTVADFEAKARSLPRADLVYLAAQPDEVPMAIRALRAAGVDAPILGGDGLDLGSAWARLDDVRNVYFTTHTYLGADNPDPQVKQFRAAFAKAYPGEEPDAFTALGYDAARLLMAAIETAGATDPRAVREAVAGTRHFAGVTGTITFSPGSQIPAKSVTIMTVEGGRQSLEASVMPTAVPAPE